jgi:DNA-directed RNA polymerase specialized sigma24 family protein
MSATGSVTNWIAQLKAGDADAAQPLWERYFSRMVALARKQLQGVRLAVADEQDVALSAFDSFCQGAMRGKFPQLTDRDDLWRLLVVITARKAIDLREWQGRKKRQVLGESALPCRDESGNGGIEQVVGDEPTPEFVNEVAEQCQRLLDRLGDDDELRRIAVWRLEGYTNPEIAERLGCSLAKVERRLRVIRKLWKAGPRPENS